MEAIVFIAAVLAMTALGMVLIHRANIQHGTRIAAHHYSEPLPGVGRRRRRKHHGHPAPTGGRSPAGSHAEKPPGST